MAQKLGELIDKISIHALREEGDGGVTQLSRAIGISIHALREEGDVRKRPQKISKNGFLSTPSARRATLPPLEPPQLYTKFLSTPSARRATGKETWVVQGIGISIHALREEGD